jgi:hypothetical protein
MSATNGWRGKAQRLIAEHCAIAYRQANILPNGRKRKQHVPYSVPPIAAALVAALNADDEHEVKRLFIVESTGAHSLI